MTMHCEMNCPKNHSPWLVSNKTNLVLTLPKTWDLFDRISCFESPLNIHKVRLHLGSWCFSFYYFSLLRYDILFAYISMVLAWDFELSLNICFFKVCCP